ncbi:MAG TPA: hypothetical protein VHI98_07395 [Vicinamibacterales bacterium]|nr:hypothetical protein [Vicinamibacterales bacterium]HEX2462068.1 hypothetical protein [Vicinamibacterales bacterium]
MAEQDAIRLDGLYLGRSHDPGTLRLYLTRNFTRYLEFKKADTLHADRNSSGGVVAWLSPNAQVTEMSAAGVTPEDFIQGGLLEQLGRASDSETVRRLLGLGKGVCDSKKEDQPKGTAPPQVSCPKSAGHCDPP